MFFGFASAFFAQFFQHIGLSVVFGMALFPVFGLGVNIMTLGSLAVAVGDVVEQVQANPQVCDADLGILRLNTRK